MNQVSLRTLSAVAHVRRPTQRALAKQRTREKILASAKALFTEKGYEGATIRDIAAAAGMSTGAVFASFNDKSDLFSEIISADRDALFEAMQDAVRAAGEAGKGVAGALLALFEAGLSLHLDDLPLLKATMAAAWSPHLAEQIRSRLERRPVTTLIAEVLENGMARGELGRDTDISLLSQMLWDSYLANFRHVAITALDGAALRARLQDQIGILLGGSSKR